MPIVPRYGDRKVQTQALPGVRKSAAETPTSTGAGLAEAQQNTGEALMQAGAGVARMATAKVAELHALEVQKQDDFVHLAAGRQLNDFELAALHDPKTGAFHTVKGQAALGLDQVVGEKFDELADKLEAEMTPRQRAAFQPDRANRRASMMRSVTIYGADEIDKAETAETKASLKASEQTAIVNTSLDPSRIGEELQRTDAIITTFAANKGLGPAVRAQLVMESHTEIHAGVIAGKLAKGHDRDARYYFDGVKEQLTPEKRAEIERQLESATNAGEGLRASDTIWQAHGPKSDTDPINLDTMEEAARKQFADDPKALDATMKYLRERKYSVDAGRKDREEAAGGALWVAASKGASLAEISRMPEFVNAPGRLQATISDYIVSHAEHDANRAYAQEGRAYTAQQRGEAAKQQKGWSRYWDLSKPETLGQTSENALQMLRGELGDDHVNNLLKAKRGLSKSDDAVRAATIDDDLFKVTAQSAGLNPYGASSEEDKSSLGQLKNAVETAIDAEQQKQGRALKRDEKQKVMRDVIEPRVMLNYWGRDPEKLAAMVTNPDDRAKAYVPIAKIPPVALSQALNYARSLSPETQRMTDKEIQSRFGDRIQRAYARRLMGGTRAEMDAILKGQE